MQSMRESLESIFKATQEVPRTPQMRHLLDSVASPHVPSLQVRWGPTAAPPHLCNGLEFQKEMRWSQAGLSWPRLLALAPVTQAPLVHAVAVAEAAFQAQVDAPDAFRRLSDWFKPHLVVPDNVRWVRAGNPRQPKGYRAACPLAAVPAMRGRALHRLCTECPVSVPRA